jgi:hypothetical protein
MSLARLVVAGLALSPSSAASQVSSGAPAAVGAGAGALQCNANLTLYCTAGTSAQGCVASISGLGIPSANAPSGFELAVGNVPGQRGGIVFYGLAPDAAPWGGGTSFRCVGLPVQRLGLSSSGGTAGACDGELRVDLNSWMQAHPAGLGSPYGAGQVLHAQGWYRDGGAPLSSNLSDALAFTLCSGNGVPPMYVTGGNLGCSSGSGGVQVSCAVTQGYVNQDLAFDFSEPVSAASLTGSTFQVIETTTGAPALGSRLVDPADPRRAIFRPKLTLDPQGNAVFGLQSGATYQIRLPGVAQGDPGPWVTSVQGEPNATRALAVVTADQGVIDYVPGAPQVAIYVLVPGSSTPVNIDGGGVNGVQPNSPLTFAYGDVMNVSTVVIPSSGQSPFVRVDLDLDGNLATTADRQPIAGSWTIAVDVDQRTTTAVFQPSGGWPTPGPGPVVAVDVPTPVTDLVGNPLANAGVRSFVP